MSTQIKSVRIKFDKLKGETPKAVLLQFGNTEHWLPKKLCWNFITNKKLGGNCVVPTWLYEKTFGEAPSEEQASELVEHHVPPTIQPNATEPDSTLIR